MSLTAAAPPVGSPLRRAAAVLVAALLAVGLGAPGVGAATAAPARQANGAIGGAGNGPGKGPGKGPVGFDTYRHLDQLSNLTRGVQTKQFSSFDRAGGNGDFNRCLNQRPDGGCTLAQRTGPGEVDSIWATNVYAGRSGREDGAGNLHVVLDGQTILNAPFQDIVEGKAGAPFVFPLVADAEQSSGGVNVLVPMPYRSSMLIYTDHDPEYYHVTYRDFADASGVSTFSAADKAPDVIAKLKAAGTADPNLDISRTR